MKPNFWEEFGQYLFVIQCIAVLPDWHGCLWQRAFQALLAHGREYAADYRSAA